MLGRREGHQIPFAFPGVVEATPIGELYCAAGTIDDHGRVSDRSALKHLTWDAGQALGFDGDDQFTAARRVDRAARRCGRSVGKMVGVALAGEVGIGKGAVTEVGVDDVVHAVAQVGAEDAVNAGVCQCDHS